MPPSIFRNINTSYELYFVRYLKVHTDAEFDLFALSANEITSQEIPPRALKGSVHITSEATDSIETDHFSLMAVST